MEAAVEELTPLGVLKQPKVLGAWSEGWTYSRAREVHSNLAGARDIERRAIPKCAMPAVPPPAWQLGFDQPCRSVNRARYIRGHRAKRILELAVEFRRATGSGLDLVQKFPPRRQSSLLACLDLHEIVGAAKPAHAAPPLAYNSQRSHAQPSRPVALAIQSVWARAVPVIPRTVCVISPLMSPPDPSPSMPMTQLLPNWRLQPTWPPPRKPLVSPVTETPGANEGTETVFSPHPPPRCPPI